MKQTDSMCKQMSYMNVSYAANIPVSSISYEYIYIICFTAELCISMLKVVCYV